MGAQLPSEGFFRVNGVEFGLKRSSHDHALFSTSKGSDTTKNYSLESTKAQLSSTPLTVARLYGSHEMVPHPSGPCQICGPSGSLHLPYTWLTSGQCYSAPDCVHPGLPGITIGGRKRH